MWEGKKGKKIPPSPSLQGCFQFKRCNILQLSQLSVSIHLITVSNCFQSPKRSGRVWCLDRKPLFHHKKANPNKCGKKWEQHITDTALQVNSWASQHIKLQPSAILYNTSNFQGFSKHSQSRTLKQSRASAPSQGRSITPSCFGTWAASSRHALENSTVQRLNAILLWGCAVLFIL